MPEMPVDRPPPPGYDIRFPPPVPAVPQRRDLVALVLWAIAGCLALTFAFLAGLLLGSRRSVTDLPPPTAEAREVSMPVVRSLPREEAAPAAPIPAPTWVLVDRWTGRGSGATERFSVDRQAISWRLRCKVAGEHARYPRMGLRVYRPDRTLVKELPFARVTDSRDGGEVLVDCGDSRGDFFFEYVIDAKEAEIIAEQLR